MLAGTSAAMLVGTCWKKILSAFLLPSALLGTENFFPFYVLPEVDISPVKAKKKKMWVKGCERGGERAKEGERERKGKKIKLLQFFLARTHFG